MHRLLSLLCIWLTLYGPFLPSMAANWLVVLSGGVPVAASTPAFVGEVACSANYIAEAATATSFTTSASIAAGHRIVVCYGISAGTTATIASSGVTWDVSATATDASNTVYIFSADLPSGLASGATITITSGTASYLGKAWAVLDLSGCATSGQPDPSSYSQSVTYGTSASLAGTTVAAKTVLVGLLCTDSITKTYSGGSWSNVGSYRDNAQNGRRFLVVTNTETTAGPKNPNGSWATGSSGLYNVWIGLK